MSNLIKIAVDAMGGDNAPKKIIDGIIHNHQTYKDNFYIIFGNESEISPHLSNKINSKFYKIVDTKNFVKSTDSPLEAAKKGKDTSMWMSIDSVKKKRLT